MDLTGFCLPAGPASGADELRVRSLLKLRQKALELLDSASVTADRQSGRSLEVLWAAFSRLSQLNVTNALDHPLAHYHLSSRTNDSKEMLLAALGLVGFLAGAPPVASLELILPARAVPRCGLFFAHLHALLLPVSGPVAIHIDSGVVTFTWIDGESATLPLQPPVRAGMVRTDRLIRGIVADQWRCLNGLTDLRGFPGLGPLDPTPPFEDAQTLTRGFDFLEQVWPEAAACCRRFFQATIFLEHPPTHTRSLSANRLQGAFIATMANALQVGDAFCHEASHTRLNLLLEDARLLQDEGKAIHPSPWRSDLRPLGSVLDGVHAFLNVCHYYRRVARSVPDQDGFAEQVFEVQRRKVREGWRYLEERARPTELGTQFLTELEREVKEL